MSTPQQFITRPAAELFGSHAAYGMAGYGVNTAIGNLALPVVDLVLPGGYLGWARTYNALDATVGILGRGWTPALSARLESGQPGGAAPVLLRADDGRVLTFTPDGQGGFTRPPDLAADLTQHVDGSYTLSFLSGEVWAFTQAGQLTSQSLDGEQVSLDYDGQGRLAAASSAGGRLDLAYDPSGRLASVASADGRTVSYGYAGDGTLSTVTTPGGVSRYESTSTGLLARITGVDGNLVVASSYDASSRVQHQDLATGTGVDFSYADSTGLTTVTSTPSGAQDSFQHDPSGHAVRITDAAGNTASFTFDAAGQLTAAATPGGTQLTQTFDSRGNLLSSDWGGAVTSYSYDESGRVASETDPSGAITRYSYAAGSRIPSQITDPDGGISQLTVQDGLVVAATDPDGNSTAYSYDAARNLTSVLSPLGRLTRFSYDAAGNRTEVSRPSGATVTLAYDAAGRLTSRADPAGNVTRYGYSVTGLLTQITDPTGASTSFGYDTAGNQTSITDALGRVVRFGYDPDGNLTSVTDLAGQTTTSSVDQLGQVTSVTDPAGAVTRYSYDAEGRQLTEQTPAGTTTNSYDALGNPVTVTDPDGATVRFGYDPASRLTAVTGPDGAVQRISYNAAGNVIAVVDPAGAVTRYLWTPGGRRAATIDPLGRTTSYGYDADGQLTDVTDPEGGITRYTYDADGRRISVTTPAGLVTRYRYDAAGQVSEIIDPRAGITTFEYSARGERTAVIQPSGAIRRLRYDPAGQLTEAIDPNGSSTQYGYDEGGHLTAVTDAKGAVTRFGYDVAGREISSTDPIGRVTHREYDAAGNLTAVTDPAGQTVRMDYDAAGRLTRRVAPDGTVVSFSYDTAGRRASMTDGSGTTHYSYDAAGRPTSVTEPDGSSLGSAYDAAGQRSALTYPDGLEIGYRYDGNRRLIGLHHPQAGDVTYALDPDGRLLTERLPGQLARHYRYAGGLLRRYRVIRDARTIVDTQLTRDLDGRILTRQDGDVRHEQQYDLAGQLIHYARSEAGPDWRVTDELRLSYDAVGNRASLRRGDVVTDYRYDDADQLIAAETAGRRTEYQYDASGRLTEERSGDRHRTISYDGFGLPTVETSTGDGHTDRAQATFSGDGLLTGLVLTAAAERHEDEQSVSVRYRWSVGDRIPQILSQRAGPSPDADTDRASRLSADFAYGYGRTFASWDHDAAVVHRDAFGSATRTEDTAAWAQADGYGPFGEPADELVPGPAGAGSEDERRPGRPPELPRFGYRGELARGPAVYLRARSYDTRLGRFTSRDPATVLRGPANVRNPYVYAGNDPLDFVDPLGTLLAPAAPSFVPGGFSAVTGLSAVLRQTAAVGCAGCANPGNGIQRHAKCFWNVCLQTRGYITQAALNADGTELNRLWNAHQPERAAQAFTIQQLDWNRAGFFRKAGTLLFGIPVPVSQNVDWEIGVPVPANPGPGYRMDIMTETQNLYEVKRYTGPATTRNVAAQLTRYLRTVAAPPYNHALTLGTELSSWADVFYVITGYSGWFNIFVNLSLVYVWGLNPPNPAGHIYFAQSDKTPRNVQTQVAQNYRVNVRPIPIPEVNWWQITRPQPLAGGEPGAPEEEPAPDIPELPAA